MNTEGKKYKWDYSEGNSVAAFVVAVVLEEIYLEIALNRERSGFSWHMGSGKKKITYKFWDLNEKK